VATVAALSACVVSTVQADYYPIPPQRPIKQPWKSGATTVTLSPDGTLRVSGTGPMEDYNNYDIYGFYLQHATDFNDYFSYYAPPGWYRADWYGDDTTGERRQRAKKPTITKIIIEEGVTYIGNRAFAYLHGLESVTIPNTVTAIGDEAFEECGMTSVAIPNSVTVIGSAAFFGCAELTSAALPDGITVIKASLFKGCVRLASVNIPNGVIEIESEAFENCRALTSVTIPDNVTAIGEEAFSGCDALTSVTIPDGVTAVWKRAFRYCAGLMSVTISKSITELGSAAFKRCPRLTSIIVRNPVPPDVMSEDADDYKEFVRDAEFSVFDSVAWSNACLYVPASGVSAYRSSELWRRFDCVKSIESIETDEMSVTALAAGIVAAGLIMSVVGFVAVGKLRKSSRKRAA